MASSLLLLLDDIAALMDDVAVLTKVAAKKTAGVLGDDLALNAEQVSGVRAERELPVVWAVFKGSMLNKLILVPAALLLSYFLPWAVTPLLVLGGLFLCFEGIEKLIHSATETEEQKEAAQKRHIELQQSSPEALVEAEKAKIKGAIRTDFILSAEIIVITLGTVAEQALSRQLSVLTVVAIAMTLGVYGLVAMIVKIDDVGLHLSKQSGWKVPMGNALLAFAPRLMKTLSVVGTAAMFLVGGGIVAHSSHALAEAIEHWVNQFSGAVSFILPTLINGLIGILAGLAVFVVVSLVQKLMGRSSAH
ncbi:MAG: DUF808 domain-containing protein [Gammaproteobacteria bacterium]|nr:DUF808 domain-containing protein [Gammaproteobacteria bacterium]